MTALAPTERPAAFRHEALLYAGLDDFVVATSRFIRAGVEAGEPTLVLVSQPKIDRLRDELGAAADAVAFANIAVAGANPGLIIPVWVDFVERQAVPGRSMRGVGEPVWAERSPAALVECQRHERLLNLAFDAGRPWWLLCPYDMTALTPSIIAEAEHSHPLVSEGVTERRSRAYSVVGPDGTLDAPLSETPGEARQVAFTWQSLSEVRTRVSLAAARAGLLSARINDLVLAANEVATNSLRHGGGCGRMRVWPTADGVVCEISDAGRVASALADRRRPGPSPADRRGLWLVNHLCDIVQVRSSASGTIVRLHMRRG